TRTAYPVSADPPLLAGADHLTVADAFPKVGEPIVGAPGTVAAGGVVDAAGPTATPVGLKGRRVEVWSTTVPWGMSDTTVTTNGCGSEVKFTWREYRLTESTANPMGYGPVSPTKNGLTPVPSRLARPIAKPPRLTQ